MYFLRKLLGYLFSFRLTKRIFNSLLPRPVRRKLTKGLNLDTGPFNRVIADVQLVPIQRDSYLAVYFKDYGTQGIGPGVSLYVFENEILRFDCFGDARGHYHSMPCLAPYPQRQRISFAETEVEDQVDESAEEIVCNHSRHLVGHFRHRIRTYTFSRPRLEAAVDMARDLMLAAHRTRLSGTSDVRPDAYR